MISHPDPNPFSPPQSGSETDTIPASSSLFTPRRGPAIPIAIGALCGALLGILMVVRSRQPIGFLGFIPGTVLGGIYYRITSASLPVDPNARRRRYKYAAFALFSMPLVVAIVTGMRAQGYAMTIGAVWIGGAFAAGILVCGDRRPVKLG